MDKLKDFMKVVLTNLELAEVNTLYQTTIPAHKLRKGLRAYFGYTTEESVTKISKQLVKRGFLKITFHGFEITEQSRKLLE